MNTQSGWFRTVASILSLSLVLMGCGSAPKVIEPTAQAITTQVMVGDHVEVEVGAGQKYEFWVTAVNDTRLQGTEGPYEQGRPVDIAIADIQSIQIHESDELGGGGGNSTLVTVLVVIGVIAAFLIFSGDDAESRFESQFPNP